MASSLVGAAVAEETWTAYTFSPAESLAKVPGLRAIASRAEEATKGAFTIEMQRGG